MEHSKSRKEHKSTKDLVGHFDFSRRIPKSRSTNRILLTLAVKVILEHFTFNLKGFNEKIISDETKNWMKKMRQARPSLKQKIIFSKEGLTKDDFRQFAVF